MKELSLSEINNVSGAGGEQVAQLAGTVAGTWLSGGNPYVGAFSGYAAGEIYNGIQNGYQTAPGVTQGVGSYNPNYNPGLIGNGSIFNPHDPDTVTNAAGASDFAKCFLSGGKDCS